MKISEALAKESLKYVNMKHHHGFPQITFLEKKINGGFSWNLPMQKGSHYS
jgi:hypothetical protein